MSARTRALIGVVFMALLLVLYFFFAGVRAVALLASGTPVAVLMGIALLVLPVIGAWALGRELMFGWRSTQLVDLLDERGLLPDDLGEVGPTGKPERAVADLAFPRYRAEAEAQPEAWTSWMRLGLVYDACGDRKRAREVIRRAIRLNRDEISGRSHN